MCKLDKGDAYRTEKTVEKGEVFLEKERRYKPRRPSGSLPIDNSFIHTIAPSRLFQIINQKLSPPN